MSQRLRPYPSYKEAGVRWLGDVPEHWDVKQLGHLGRFSKGNGGTKEDEVPTGVPCIRYGDLYTQHRFFIHRSRAYVAPERATAYTPVQFGDILFAASGETIEEIGKSAVNLIESQACCGGDILLFRPSVRVSTRFMGYVCDCPPVVWQKSLMSRGFTVMHIYGHQLKHLGIPLPPISEQAAIVRFLDHFDLRINRLIRAKQRLIDLLKEQKQAIINRAVTRGLDPHVRLEPSGIDWLGDVPAHWEVKRSKRTFTPRKELAQPTDIQLSATQAYGVIPQDEYERRVSRKIVKIFHHLDKRRHVEVDDFVISMRSFQGGLERAWASGCIRSSYIVLRPTVRVDVGFFSRVFKSLGYIGALQSTANFIRDGQDLNFRNFCAVDLPFPPLEEQWQIAQTVDALIARTTNSEEKTKREINLLDEYRTRLIADVVTGKLDVREAAAGLPNEPLGEATLSEEAGSHHERMLDDAELMAEAEED